MALRHMARKGFSLIELSIVLVIAGMVMAGAYTIGSSQIEAAKQTQTQEKMDAIWKALEAYRYANNRLPCPADITQPESNANFGLSVSSDCSGTNFSNGNAVAGAVPVRALGLSNEFMTDGWGRRFVYNIDRRMAEQNAYVTYKGTDTSLSGYNVKDAGGTDITVIPGAIAVLVSHGPNGHGGYNEDGSARINSGSTNVQELDNCNCNSSAAATAFNTSYVAKSLSVNPASSTDVFDDLVQYKMTSDFRKPEEMEQAAAASVVLPDTDVTAPMGYSVEWLENWVYTGNQNSAAFQIVGGEYGAKYTYTIKSSSGATILTDEATISSNPQVLNVDVSSLLDGTLTLTVTLTDGAGNKGGTVIDTLIKDTVPPSGYTIAWTTTPIDGTNVTAAAFRINNPEANAKYKYTITDSGSGSRSAPDTAITASPQNVTGINLSTLANGTLTLSVTLTDQYGNVGAPVTATVTKSVPPPAYTVEWWTPTQNYINNTTKTGAAFRINCATTGLSFTYTITSDAGGTPVTGSGTTTSTAYIVNGINVAGLNDGTLTVSVVMGGPAATDTVPKDTVAPTSYSVSIQTNPIHNYNKHAVVFRINLASNEVGGTVLLSVRQGTAAASISDRALAPTLTSALSQDRSTNVFSPTNVPDGNVSAAIKVTDAAGNTGLPSAWSATVVKNSDPCWISIDNQVIPRGTYCPHNGLYYGGAMTYNAYRAIPYRMYYTPAIAYTSWNHGGVEHQDNRDVFGGNCGMNRRSCWDGQWATPQIYSADARCCNSGHQWHQAAKVCTEYSMWSGGGFYLPSQREAEWFAPYVGYTFWTATEVGKFDSVISNGGSPGKKTNQNVICIRHY